MLTEIFSQCVQEGRTGCLLWTGRKLGGESWRNPHDRYGAVQNDGKTVPLHRLVYMLVNGPIPDGLFICHRCNNKGCCNPDHLYAGTRTQNAYDSVDAGTHNHARQTHCLRGHPLFGENLGIGVYGNRFCRICAHESKMKWQRQHRDAERGRV